MPYIKPENRKKYETLLTEAVDILLDHEDMVNTFYDFLSVLSFYVFNACSYSVSDKRILQIATELGKLVPEGEGKVGEFNYVVSTVAWGITGAIRFGTKYSTYSAIRGALRVAEEGVANNRQIEDRILIRGVFGDIIDEMYRRQVVLYEDDKIVSNGDLWSNGKISIRDGG